MTTPESTTFIIVGLTKQGRKFRPSDWAERLARLQCAALDVNHQCLTSDIVAQAHGAGFRVCCYTPNDPARVRELAEWGVDTIITDAVDVIPA